jgi:AAHS family 4-hydroxybenzoate transporter-like MFS transporter
MKMTIRPSELIDTPELSRLQYLVFFLCAASVFVDGYDTQVVAYIAPTLSKAWHLPPGALGPVFAATLLGSALGSLLLAPLADRWGRQRTIVWATAVIGVFMLACSFAPSIAALEGLRFCAGLGLGAAVPNALALVTEYAPSRRRIGLATLVFCGYPVGAVFGALVATQLTPRFGWPAVFQFGAAVTLLLLPCLQRYLPESLTFLSLSAPEGARAQGLIRRLRPGLARAESCRLESDEQRVAVERPFPALFSEGRTGLTGLLGLLAFLTLIDLYLLTSWLPTLVNSMGFSLNLASAATAAFQLGGIAGTLAFGWVGERLGVLRIIPVAYLAAAVLIGCIAMFPIPGVITLAAFGSGVMLIGAQSCNNGIVSSAYPTAARATAIGFNLTIGRIGSIIGPFVTGVLLAARLSAHDVLLLATVPAVGAAVSMLFVGRVAARSRLDLAARPGLALARER